jgi:hypothetical protein
VIGDHLERVVLEILRLRFPRGCLDEGLEEIDFIVRMNAL